MFNWKRKLLIIILASAFTPLAFSVKPLPDAPSLKPLPDGWRAKSAAREKAIMDAHSKTVWCEWLSTHGESSDNVAAVSASYSASVVQVFVEMDYPYQKRCDGSCSSPGPTQIDISTPEIASKTPDIFQWGQEFACGITARDVPFVDVDPPVFSYMRHTMFKKRALEVTLYEMPPAVRTKKDLRRRKGLSEDEMKNRLPKFNMDGMWGGRFNKHNQKLHAQLCGKLRTEEGRGDALSNANTFEAFYRPVLAEADIILDYPDCGYDFCAVGKQPERDIEIYTPEFFVNTQAASCGWLQK